MVAMLKRQTPVTTHVSFLIYPILFSLWLCDVVNADLIIRDDAAIPFFSPRLSSEKQNPLNSTGAIDVRRLFARQRTCAAGYGYCDNNGGCCPSGNRCCSNSCVPPGGRCCTTYGHSCRSGTSCCETGCIPTGTACCSNGNYCDAGYFCCGGDNRGCAPQGAECCRGWGYCKDGNRCVIYRGRAGCCPGGICGSRDGGYFISGSGGTALATEPIVETGTSVTPTSIADGTSSVAPITSCDCSDNNPPTSIPPSLTPPSSTPSTPAPSPTPLETPAPKADTSVVATPTTASVVALTSSPPPFTPSSSSPDFSSSPDSSTVEIATTTTLFPTTTRSRVSTTTTTSSDSLASLEASLSRVAASIRSAVSSLNQAPVPSSSLAANNPTAIVFSQSGGESLVDCIPFSKVIWLYTALLCGVMLLW